MQLDNKKTCGDYGRRATRNRHASVFVIEGETLTMAQIAERLKVDMKKASNRMFMARRKPGAVTWQSLGLKQ